MTAPNPVTEDMRAQARAAWAALDRAHEALAESVNTVTLVAYTDALRDFRLAFEAHNAEVLTRARIGLVRR